MADAPCDAVAGEIRQRRPSVFCAAASTKRRCAVCVETAIENRARSASARLAVAHTDAMFEYARARRRRHAGQLPVAMLNVCPAGRCAIEKISASPSASASGRPMVFASAASTQRRGVP